MNPVESIEIKLDKVRHLRFDHKALYEAEMQINKLRGALPHQHLSIDSVVVRAVGEHLLQVGFFPRDLTLVMIWAGLKHEEPGITIDIAARILDNTEVIWSDVSAAIWKAYRAFAGKNISDKEDGDKDNADEDPQKRPGANSGASGGLD